MNKKVKHFTIKQSIKNALDNGTLNLDYIFSDDIATFYCHDVTYPFDEYKKYSIKKDNPTDIQLDYIKQGFKGRDAKIQKWDMFLHDANRSYGRYVSIMFYVGPCCYQRVSGETIIAETYVALDLYDPRSTTFAKNLSASLQEPLSDKDVAWLTDKLNKTR